MTCNIVFNTKEEKKGANWNGVKLSDNFFFVSRGRERDSGRLLNLSKVLERKRAFSINGVRSGVKPFLRHLNLNLVLASFFVSFSLPTTTAQVIKCANEACIFLIVIHTTTTTTEHLWCLSV